MDLQLGTGLRQEQTLSVQMLQAVNILQMNSQDLELTVKHELEENPMLELEDSESDAENHSADSETDAENNLDSENSNFESDDSDDAEAGMLEDRQSIDWDEYFKEGFGETERPIKDLNANDPEKEEWKNQTKASVSMQDALLAQLRDWKRSPEVMAVAEYLIDSLDDLGYLQNSLIFTENDRAPINLEKPKNQDILEAERVIEGVLELENASNTVQEAFHVLHSLTPRGIGARNLRECLLIQAYAIPDFPKLTIRILESHFDDLKALRYTQIAKDLNISHTEVLKAVQTLSTLSPHPGLLINNSPVAAIVPDIEVIEIQTTGKDGKTQIEYRVELLRSFKKRLRINETYKKLLLTPNVSKQDKAFIRERLNKANIFIDCVNLRETTIERVMKEIIRLQPEFFQKGPEFLQPMILQGIADSLHVNLSTISRAVNGKYVETKFGVFELRNFFSIAVRQENGSEISSKRIMDAIKNLIDAEDKSNPLSDQALTDALAQSGIKVARRTVAKYREEDLKILSARYRKQK